MGRHSLGTTPLGVDPVESAASGVLSDVEDVLVKGGRSLDGLAVRLSYFAAYGSVVSASDRAAFAELAERVESICDLVSDAHD